MTEDQELTIKQKSEHEFHHLLTQMQEQIRELEHHLDECNHRLYNSVERMKAIEWALNIARQSAECLLTDNPFEAWDKFVEEDELGVFCDTSTTRMQQAETTTARPMRQQLGDAIKRLDEYHRCLTGFLDDLSKLENFDTALRLSNNLTGDPPLETAETRKKRKEADEGW
jgi:hypothetical protein